MLFPFIFMILTSLKTYSESIAVPPKLLPNVAQFENYKIAMEMAPFDIYFNSLRSLRTTVLFIIIFTIVVACGIVFFLIGLLIKPLKTVKNSIETIASGNADLTQRIPEGDY